MLLFCVLVAVASPTITAEGARLEMESGAVIVAETARLSADGAGEATHVRASHVGQSLTIQADHTRWLCKADSVGICQFCHVSYGPQKVSDLDVRADGR